MMKKLLFLCLLAAFALAGCSDDDKGTVVLSFEGKLTEAESEFISTSRIEERNYYIDTFNDNANLIAAKHYYNYWGAYYAAGFTYTNKIDNTEAGSIAAITKKAKVGTTYLYAYTSEYTPAWLSINNSTLYNIKGAWVTNSTYSYNSMTEGDDFAQPFTKGDSFKLIATGHTSSVVTGTAEIYLANYTSNKGKPVSDWIWFDLTPLGDADLIVFRIVSTDENTPTSFCMDGITLEEK